MLVLLTLLVLSTHAVALPGWVSTPPSGYVVGVGEGPTQVEARRQALEEARVLLLEAQGVQSQKWVSDTLRTRGALTSVLTPELRRQAITTLHAQGQVRLRPVQWHDRCQEGRWIAYVLVPQPETGPVSFRRYDPGAALRSSLVPGLGQLGNGRSRGWSFLISETVLLGGGSLLFHWAREETLRRDRDRPAYYRAHNQRARLAFETGRVLWVAAGFIHLWNIIDAYLSPADPWQPT